jgi:hypothetical protein
VSTRRSTGRCHTTDSSQFDRQDLFPASSLQDIQDFQEFQDFMADKGDFIKAVKISGERHNVTFPAEAMKVLGVGRDEYVSFYVGQRPGEVLVRRTDNVNPRPPSN